eukprot:4530418-Pyramimonas_sp.AAC.2
MDSPSSQDFQDGANHTAYDPADAKMHAADDQAYSGGAFINPKVPLVVEGIEHKVESIIGKDVRVFLWVDSNGLKIVDAHKKSVQWSARLNTIVQWAVRDDYFWCRMLYKKGEQRERGFLTGYSKAVKLKAAIETFVHIHLKDPDYAKTLCEDASDPAQVCSLHFDWSLINGSEYSRADPWDKSNTVMVFALRIVDDHAAGTSSAGIHRRSRRATGVRNVQRPFPSKQ